MKDDDGNIWITPGGIDKGALRPEDIVKVTPEGMKKLGARTLQPGMPVQVTIRTGERSLMTYLLKPLMLRFAGAMKES